MHPFAESYTCFPNRFFQGAGGNEDIHTPQPPPTTTTPPISLSLFSKTHFYFNSSELISAACHIHVLISHLRPAAAAAAWTSQCQDTVWTDKNLPVNSRLHLSLFSNKAALRLSLHALLLLISADCMSCFPPPSALFVLLQASNGKDGF